MESHSEAEVVVARLVALGEHLERPAVAGQLAVGSTDSKRRSSDAPLVSALELCPGRIT